MCGDQHCRDKHPFPRGKGAKGPFACVVSNPSVPDSFCTTKTADYRPASVPPSLLVLPTLSFTDPPSRFNKLALPPRLLPQRLGHPVTTPASLSYIFGLLTRYNFLYRITVWLWNRQGKHRLFPRTVPIRFYRNGQPKRYWLVAFGKPSKLIHPSGGSRRESGVYPPPRTEFGITCTATGCSWSTHLEYW